MLSQQESSRKDPDSEREVFRSAGSMVLSWAWFVVALIILVDLAVQGRDHAALVTAALVIAITGVVYACAWRPRIVADSTGITIANPLRDHRVPWSAVTNVDVVNAVRVHCAPAPGAARGKILYSWAVQSSARSTRKTARRSQTGRRQARLTPRPRSLGPPPGATPRYGEIPEPARDALERSSAEFTAGRLAERAQHARRAAEREAPRPAPGPAGDVPVAGDVSMAEDVSVAGAAPVAGDPPAAGRMPAAGDVEAGVGAAAAGDLPASHSPADGSPAVDRPGPVAVPVSAEWAWRPVAAMAVPLALLVLVVLL